jgi:hypothetical protein
MQPEENKNVFRRAGDAIKNTVGSIKERTDRAVLASQSDMQSSILAMVLPHVKRMIPTMEEKLKKYMLGQTTDDGPGDGKKKAILMKMREDGKIQILIFDAHGISVEMDPNFSGLPEDVLLNQFNVDEYVLRFLRGNFDTTTEDSESV